MRAARYHEHGDPSVLTVEDVDRPSPGAGEVLVEVRAAGVNPIDTYIVAGNVPPAYGLPGQAGSDLAGVVAETGSDVEGFAASDHVYATALGLFEPGSLAEYVAVPADVLAGLPESVPFDEGAAAAMAFATAWLGIVDRGDLTLGETCLVSGAAGGVGHAGVQVAREAGATVVALARGEGDERDRLHELGADAVVDYRADDLAAEVEAAVGGIDVALESHADANLLPEIEAVRRGGRVVVIGEDDRIALDSGPAMTAKQADLDVRFTSLAASRGEQRRLLESAAAFLGDGTFEAHVDSRFPLADVTAAYDRLAESGRRGRVVVELD